MVTAAQLVAKVSVEGADVAKSALSGVGGAIGGLALAGGAALIGLGVQSVKMAGDFQAGMTSLVTGAGESQANLKMVSDGILNLATSTGTSTKQLTDGMYMIESAGFHGAQGLSVLQAAAQGAKVGNADLGTVASAVTTVMHDYASSNLSATQATNALITTVASGKTHMQDIASSLSTVLPLASSLHIPFNQVAGAMATMTNAGMTAQHASQNLAFAIRALNVETPKGSDALKQLGLSADQVHNDLQTKGLPATLKEIEDHIGKQFPLDSMKGQQALKDIMGGAAGLNAALMLSGSHMKEFEGDVNSIGASLSSKSKDVQNWSNVQSDFNTQIDRAKEAVETFGIKIGTALLPLVGQFISFIVDKGMPILNSFANWFTTSAVPAIQKFAGWINENVVPALSKLWDWLQISILPVLMQFGQSILNNVIPVLQTIWSVLTTIVIPALGQFLNWIGPLLTNAFNGVLSIYNATLGPVFGFIADSVSKLTGINFGGFKDNATSAFNSVTDSSKKMSKGVSDDTNYVKNDSNDISTSLSKIGKTKIDSPTSKLPANVQNDKNKIQSAWDQLIKTVTAPIDFHAIDQSFNDSMTSIKNGLSSAGEWLWNKAIDIGSSIIAGIITGISNFIGTLKDLLTNIVNFYIDDWNLISDIIKGKWDKISSDAQKWGGDIVGIITDTFQLVLQAAMGPLNTINDMINGILGKQDSITGQNFAPKGPADAGPQVPKSGHAFASGTDYAPGGMSLIGEQGPELMYIPRGAQIIPNNQLVQSTQQSQQIVVQAPNIYLDGRLIANGLMPQITNAIRYGTGVNNF